MIVIWFYFVKLFLLINGWEVVKESYMDPIRKSYNTTLRKDLMKKLRILAAELEKRQNDLLEEAISDLLLKYKKKAEE